MVAQTQKLIKMKEGNYVYINNTITIIELENHLYKWFGPNWDNQSGGQVYAMVIELLAKVNTEIVSE